MRRETHLDQLADGPSDRVPHHGSTAHHVVECKVLRRSVAETVVFDRDEDKPWSDKIFNRVERVESVAIHVWGM